MKSRRPSVVVEASGGITVEALPHFVGPHIDVVSMGALTHSAPPVDFSLRVVRGGGGGE